MQTKLIVNYFYFLRIQSNTRSAEAEDRDGEIIDETDNHKFLI